MNSIYIAFFLTFFSGLSTMIGTIPIFIPIHNENRIISFCLGLASGVMLCISITDLIPESMSMLSHYCNGFLICLLCFLFIVIGLLSSYLIDKKLILKYHNNSLYKVGIKSMLGIIIHNIPEGIITFISSTKNIYIGISLAIAITLHNIPEGISISIPIYYSTKNRRLSFFYTFIAALSEPLGAIITYIFLYKVINLFLLGLLLSFTAGIMIEISLGELFHESKSYTNTTYTIISFMIGFFMMILKFVIL